MIEGFEGIEGIEMIEGFEGFEEFEGFGILFLEFGLWNLVFVFLVF
jgi:hypothetical protein